MAGARNFAHPMLAVPLNQTAQCDRQDTVVKGIIGLGKLPFGLSLPPELDNEFRPFPIAPLMQVIVP